MNDLKVEYRNIKELIPYCNNSRTHSDDQVLQIASSIKEFGFTNPVLIDGQGGIIAGHGRIMAAQKLKMDEVPTITLSDLSEAQKKAYIIADNKLALNSGWDDELLKIELEQLKELDFDLGLIGFSDDELALLMGGETTEGLVDEDQVPELVDDPVTVLGDVWLLGNHRLMCGDSTSIDAVERLMDGQKADMVFTDPPYGISIVQNNQVGGGGAFGVGKEAKKKGKFIKANKHKEVIGDDTIDVAVSAIKIIKELDIKTQIIWGGNYYANHLDNSNCWIVWDKQTGDSTFADAELAWTNQETKVRVFQHRWSGMVKASEHGEKRVHPTQKPIALALWCFEHYGEKDKGVLDLFGGSGSTLIACEKTGRHCRMMELDPHYCDVIIKRWQDFTGKQATLESNGKTYNELLNDNQAKNPH